MSNGIEKRLTKEWNDIKWCLAMLCSCVFWRNKRQPTHTHDLLMLENIQKRERIKSERLNGNVWIALNYVPSLLTH